MEGVSIIIPVFNNVEITIKCINNIRKFNKKDAFEIIIVDNGSTDSTPQILLKDEGIVYVRNQKNLGLSKAYNHASDLVKNNVLCFMHNDVFVLEKNWSAMIQDFIMRTPEAGIIGLYGAKKLRKDSSFRGKTIVHSKKGFPSITNSFEKVAVVDGLLMAMKKSVFTKIGGFNENFPVHYYDKDISLRSLTNSLDNYVLNILFEHTCAVTRKGIKKDDKLRNEAQKIFLQIWNDHLPVDVSTWRDKLSYLTERKMDN